MLKDKKFFVNSVAVFFDNKIDKENGWETLVCNPVNSNYIKVNPEGYKILRVIEENPGLNFFEVVFKAKKNEDVAQKFLQKMIDENVVFVQ